MEGKVNNLELWNQFCNVDMKFTKPAKKGAYQFTSVSPMYQKREATRVLGVQGIGWGVIPDSEKWEQQQIGETILLSYKAILFFKFNGERGEISIAATEKLAYKTQGASGYLKIDDEADKKVRTSALTKGLSEIGVSADVHMNLHNDYEHMEIVGAKQRMEGAEDKDEQMKVEGEKFNEWLNEQLETLDKVPHPTVVDTISVKILNRAHDKLTVLKVDDVKRQSIVAKIHNRAAQAKQNLANKKDEK